MRIEVPTMELSRCAVVVLILSFGGVEFCAINGDAVKLAIRTHDSKDEIRIIPPKSSFTYFFKNDYGKWASVFLDRFVSL
jgi:hypothetical protein